MAEMSACITVDWSCLGEDFPGAYTPDQVTRAELFAQSAIRILTGFQVGGCPITVRPCVGSCAPDSLYVPYYGSPWVPFIRDGVWYNGCGCNYDQCSCTELTQIHLDGPVGSVPVVKVDGVELTPGTDFRVDVHDTLVRLGGPEWPTCQNMTLADTEVGTMSVTYVKGVELDTMGEFIAGVLAKEYLDACTTKKCRLPASVTSIVRQGVTMEISSDVFPGGRTNIPEVDLWVRTWNPYTVKMPSTIHSPDAREPRRTQWV